MLRLASFILWSQTNSERKSWLLVEIIRNNLIALYNAPAGQWLQRTDYIRGGIPYCLPRDWYPYQKPSCLPGRYLICPASSNSANFRKSLTLRVWQLCLHQPCLLVSLAEKSHFIASWRKQISYENAWYYETAKCTAREVSVEGISIPDSFTAWRNFWAFTPCVLCARTKGPIRGMYIYMLFKNKFKMKTGSLDHFCFSKFFIVLILNLCCSSVWVSKPLYSDTYYEIFWKLEWGKICSFGSVENSSG